MVPFGITVTKYQSWKLYCISLCRNIHFSTCYIDHIGKLKIYIQYLYCAYLLFVIRIIYSTKKINNTKYMNIYTHTIKLHNKLYINLYNIQCNIQSLSSNWRSSTYLFENNKTYYMTDCDRCKACIIIP